MASSSLREDWPIGLRGMRCSYGTFSPVNRPKTLTSNDSIAPSAQGYSMLTPLARCKKSETLPFCGRKIQCRSSASSPGWTATLRLRGYNYQLLRPDFLLSTGTKNGMLHHSLSVAEVDDNFICRPSTFPMLCAIVWRRSL